MRTYQKIATLSKKLPLEQQKQILAMVEEMVNLMETSQGEDMMIVKAPKTANPHCPYCQDGHMQKSGKKGCRQRYRCLECKRWINLITMSIIAIFIPMRNISEFIIKELTIK